MKITYGGFIKENVRDRIIGMLIESGDPENMFRAIRDAVEEIEDSWRESDDDVNFWEILISNYD